MITKISGRRYDFEIETERGRRYSTFSVRAISRDSGRYSSINNLNAILSALDIEGDNPKFYDSAWTLTNKETNIFENAIKQSLSSPFFINYLESKLDEDRTCGEWANSIPSSSVQSRS